jgi:hypothetical protein
MAGPEDLAAAGRDRQRAGHTDRERLIEALKDAFAHGRLTGDELDMRAGRALSARTHADLAALTADLPAEPAAARLARPPPRPTAGRWSGRPLSRAAAWSSRSPPCCSAALSSIQIASARIRIAPGLP